MISVIMPVFNAEKFVAEAIESILTQTYRNFEFIIVDDGSSDGTSGIIKSFKDKRIYYYRNKKNLGIAASLNKAILLAKGALIARMDADDIARRDRFEKQLGYLTNHSQVGVVGSWVELINEKGKSLGTKKYPYSFEQIKHESLFRNPINHATVMLRKKLVDIYGKYDEKLNGAEDYDLWLRLLPVTQIVNLPQTLVRYRLLKKSVSFEAMRRVELAFLRAKIRSVFEYHYPLWHLLIATKSLVSLFIPLGIRRKIYETYFNY